MQFLLVLLFLASSVTALPSLFGKEQSAGVTGVLKCNGVPAVGVKVKIYDVDTTDLDDLMAEGKSDSQGKFTLKGKETELTTIDPKVNIYHKCNYEGLCLKKVAIVIPKTYVSEGPEPKKIFDIGELNLAGKFSGESTDCLN